MNQNKPVKGMGRVTSHLHLRAGASVARALSSKQSPCCHEEIASGEAHRPRNDVVTNLQRLL
jgi:hypothetical protein